MRYSLTIALYFLVFGGNAISQNVGVGTGSPTEKLHVAGNIKGDTLKPNALKLALNAGTGKVLTSDGNGNASWQSSNAATAAGNVGFGVWGDCATNGNISEYHPVGDEDGQTDDFFGTSVSISGDFAIIGSPGEDVGTNVNQGSASIYRYSGNGWVFFQKILDPTGAASDSFGVSVSIFGNYALVGAPFDNFGADANQGTACVFFFNGTSWNFTQRLSDAEGDLGDNFGFSVAISNTYAIVGAPNDDNTGANHGSVLTFVLNSGSWQFQQKLNPASANDRFGYSLALSGNRFIAGAPFDGFTGTGSARIYQYNGVNWLLQEFLAPVLDMDDHFGYSVSISGDYAIVGAPNRAFRDFPDAGAAYVYRYNGSEWINTQIIGDMPTDGPINSLVLDHFGTSVSISEKYIIVGITGYDGTPTDGDNGASLIFQRVGQYWHRLQFILDPARYDFDEFGNAVQIDGLTKRFLIGAKLADPGGKVVFGKVN